MPLYDFECVQCGHPFEAFLKMSDSGDELFCPQCGAQNPRKLISLVRSSAWSTFLDKMERKISPEKLLEKFWQANDKTFSWGSIVRRLLLPPQPQCFNSFVSNIFYRKMIKKRELTFSQGSQCRVFPGDGYRHGSIVFFWNGPVRFPERIVFLPRLKVDFQSALWPPERILPFPGIDSDRHAGPSEHNMTVLGPYFQPR